DIMVPQGRFHGNRGLVGGSHSGMFNNEDAWIEIVPNNLELLVGENRDEEIWCLPLFGALSEFELCASACWIASREPYIHFLADGYDCGIQIFDTSEDSASGQPVAVAFGIIGNRPHATPDE